LKPVSLNRTCFTITLILLLGMALRVHGLVPMLDMLHYDEAYYAADAISLIHDPRLTPFFPENYGRESLWMYWLTPALSTFLEYPPGAVFAVRLTAVFTGVLTIAAVYRLGRELLGRRAGLWAAAALAVLFWHVLMSHQGYRALLYPLVGALAFAFLWAGRRTGKLTHWIAGGVFLGLLFYTYFAARLWIGLAGLLLVYWFIALPARRRGVLLAGGIAFALWLPLLGYLLNNPALASQRLDQVAVSSAGQVVENLALWGRVLFSEGIPDPVYFLKGRPLLDIATGVLLLAGAIALIVGIRHVSGRGGAIAIRLLWLLALIAASLAPAVLTTEPLKMLRAFGLVVPLALVISAGAAWLQGFNLWRLGTLLPALALVWAGVGTWRDFETWVSSPDLYLPMEQHLMQASRPSGVTIPLYYTPFPQGHPVLRVLSESLGKANLAFKGYECLAVQSTASDVTYFSLDMFDPGFVDRLSQWAVVEEVLAEPIDVPRWRIYSVQPKIEWGADRIAFGEMQAQLLRPLPEAAKPGDTIEITLGLQAQTALTRSYTAFVHFYGDPSPVEGGAILAQVDAPLCPSYPPPVWLPGETIIQTLMLTLPPDLAPGRYQFSLGVYDSLTLERLPVTYPPDQTDYILIGSIAITGD
jgi:hypothetical protein